MDEMVQRLLNAYNSLTDAQREQVKKRIDEKTGFTKIEEGFVRDTKVVMGPLGGGCPFCGR